MKRVHNFLNFKKIKESSDIDREIRDELEVRISPSTGKIPQNEIFEIAEMYERDLEEIATLAFTLEAEYAENKEADKKDEIDAIAESAMITCNFLEDKSVECFERELKFILENINLENVTEKEVLDKVHTIYNDFKDIDIEAVSRPHLPIVLINKIDELKNFKPDITIEEIYSDLEEDFNFYVISRLVALKLIEEYIK